MWNKPTQKELESLPKLYSTEKIPAEEKKILMHFFLGSSDWYICEYDPEQRLFFGYAVLNNDWEMSEWGYVSFDELLEVKKGFVEVDHDLHWKVIKFSELKR